MYNPKRRVRKKSKLVYTLNKSKNISKYTKLYKRTVMIDSIRLQNYKAFDDVKIPLRPITILLGANSTGKSSITQMLMLLHQTSEESGDTYSSALKIYGKYVNMGAPENLLKRKATDKPLCIDITIKSEDLISRITRMKDDYVEAFRQFDKFYLRNKLVDSANSKVTNTNEFKSYIDHLFYEVEKEREERKYPRFFSKSDLNEMGVTTEEFQKKEHRSIYRTYDFLSKLSDSINQWDKFN